MSKAGSTHEPVSNAVSAEQQIFQCTELRGGEGVKLDGPVVRVSINAPDPAAAVEHVTRYLADNNINIVSSRASEPPYPPLNLGMSQIGLSKSEQQPTHVAIANQPGIASEVRRR